VHIIRGALGELFRCEGFVQYLGLPEAPSINRTAGERSAGSGEGSAG
jgi:hypothetical protein